MSSLPTAGIDVSADFVDLAFSDQAEVVRYPRNRAGLRSLTCAVRRRPVQKVALEASGGYEAQVADTLADAGIPVAVVAPQRVRAFAHALNRRAKTDALDARLIALFALQVETPVRLPQSAEMRELRSLVARRKRLQDQIAAAKQEHPVHEHQTVVRQRQQEVKFLRRQRGEIDRQIATTLAAEPAWDALDTLLRSVPGVGVVVSATLIAEFPELGTVNRKQAAALAGLAPFNWESGKMRGRRSIAGGRGAVRRALYWAAMVGARRNPWVKGIYEGLLAAGKPKKLALTACMRRILLALNEMVRTGKPWDPAMS